MTCPACHGSGRVRKRFLLFFTRRARCRQCLGTGEYPPPAGERLRYAPRLRDDDTGIGFGAGSVDTSTSGTRDRDDGFMVRSGGRSGGGGGGASWGDADAPVIVDPFAGAGSSVVDAAVAGDGTSAERDDSSAAGDSDSSATESSGPSY